MSNAAMMFAPPSPEEKMAQARHTALKKAPYYASAIYKFTFIGEEEMSGAMSLSTGMVLRYLIPWVKVASIDELAADIIHEVWHLLSDHFGRWEDIIPGLQAKTGLTIPELQRICNMGGDLAANPPIRAAGWKMCSEGPYKALFPSDFKDEQGKPWPDNLGMEEYVQRLLQQVKKQGFQSLGPGGHIGAGNCGSIARGKDPDPDERTVELETKFGKSELDRAAAVAQVMQDVKKHVQSNGRGSVPGQLVEWLDALDIPSVVPWTEEVNQFTSESVGEVRTGSADFSLARPSKRSHARGMLRPGLIDYEPVIGMVLDSSGSMGIPQLKAGAREFAAVLEQLGITEVWFAEADCGVAMEWRRVGLDFFLAPEIRGRGGTDFRPAITSARKLDPKPDILIYGTDGDGAVFKNPPPDMEVIWLLVPGPWTRVPANWGKIIIMEDDPVKKTQLLSTIRPFHGYEGEDDEYSDEPAEEADEEDGYEL